MFKAVAIFPPDKAAVTPASVTPTTGIVVTENEPVVTPAGITKELGPPQYGVLE